MARQQQLKTGQLQLEMLKAWQVVTTQVGTVWAHQPMKKPGGGQDKVADDVSWQADVLVCMCLAGTSCAGIDRQATQRMWSNLKLKLRVG